jgi:site-specific recombinase XerD
VADAFSGPLDGYALWLATEGRPRSTSTVRNYCHYLRQLRSYALQRGLSGWEQLTRAHIRAFLAERRESTSEASVAVAFYALKGFFRYLEGEELEGTGYRSPMATATAPRAPQAPRVEVLSRDQLRRLFGGAAKGGALDEALLRLLADTGIRRSEAAGMKITDLQMSQAPRLLVHGKGGKDRVVIPGTKTSLALRRYLRARADHPKAESTDWFWLGPKGRQSAQSLYKRVVAAGRRAGLKVRPHQLRHTWAHHYRANGGALDDLVYLAGWSGPAMALRYGASAAGERAENAARRLSLGDQL